MNACDACLQRAHLLALVGPHIARGIRPAARDTRTLLALSNADLAYAVAGRRVEEVLDELARFHPPAMRALMRKSSLRAVCRHDATYPARLLQLPDAPSPLFVRAATAKPLTELLGEHSVAIVGARLASTYALEMAHELGRDLALSGVPVVSGLARGIDGAAHRGTLAGGGVPIAVLASGADVPYPRQNSELHTRVAATGAVISEMPPGTTARRWAFPARNRIMAALVNLVIVAEAAERSGTLITAQFAGQLDCDVGAVPGRVNAASAAGSNKLLVEGATPILDVQNALDLLYGVGNRAAPPPLRVSLDGPGRAVLTAVENGESPVSMERLEAKEIRAALGRLEVLGLVRRDGLGGYERTGVRCEHA